MVTQVEIARRVGLDVSSVNKILNRRPGPVFRRETIKNVFKTARELGYDFGRLKHQHRRRYPRKTVSISAEVYVYRKDGSLYDQGVATIRDLSVCGARISDLALPLASLPAEPFWIRIKPMQKPADEVDLPGHIVRFHPKGLTGYGVDFERLDTGAEKKLRRISGA